MSNTNPYGTAQICLNGHVIVDAIEFLKFDVRDYCNKCGEATITECPHCRARIRGNELDNGYSFDFSEYEKPNFCEYCGGLFPWLSRGLEAASELADLIDEFNDVDRELLVKNLNDLVANNPRANVAALTVKKILRNTDPHIRTAFKDTLNGIIAEPIIRLIWG